ncbi:MAG: hypothetical protein M0R70_08480 [Nitrospirae bacterium]|nr:hypothetical protein [Nitrospirota bacterium]
MIKMKLPVLIFSLCALLFLEPDSAVAEELEIVNHPVNTSGLTGLLLTTSPYTLTPKTVEIGASVLSENSIRPDYTITEYPLSATIGISNNSELALRTSYISISEGPTGTTVVTRKTGDIELSYKWNFIPHQEDSLRPAVALIITGLMPTENNSDLRANSVSHWGMRLGLSAGTEVSWKEHIVGIYADGQMAGQDLTDKRLKDLYWIFNAGLLFPISKYGNLQMFIEYSLITGKDLMTLSGGDYTGLTYGLRLVTERFNLTIGTQSLHKKLEGYDNSGRVIGMMSMKF